MIRLPENQALRAGLFMVLAMGSFVSNDTLIKLVGQSLPVGEIIMLRGFMAFLHHRGHLPAAGCVVRCLASHIAGWCCCAIASI